ncbi:MAG TPA: hypothetical protein PKA41_03405 [Verrucomicrobiota bacterium]|nr:hypothetical protein [Verrucomicrobiota bacterium]
MKRNLALIVKGIVALELTFNVTAQTPPTAARSRLPSSGWKGMPGSVRTNRLSRGTAQVAKRIETAQQAALAYVIGKRGPDYKEWLRVTTSENRDGSTQTRTNRAFIELATGMHYREGDEWKETRELIEPFSGGAIARYGPHTAFFADNLNSSGATVLELPDGQRLVSQFLGLICADTNSGKSAWIAQVQNCKGQIVNSNQVLYAGALGKWGDVRYTYTKSGWEQDVILKQCVSPEDYGFDAKSTVIQAVTEFLSPPQPVKLMCSVPAFQGREITFEDLDWGTARVRPGKAFATGSGASSKSVSTFNQWVKIDERVVLVEQVAFEVLQQEMESLPEAEGASVTPANRKIMTGSLQLPPQRIAKAGTNVMEIAAVTEPAQGLVLDYYVELTGSLNNYTFKSDTTYYISGIVNLSGTTTFEGTVIKYAQGASLRLAYHPNPINCLSSPYMPCVFTDKNDDSIGEFIPGSTGYPSSSGNPALSTTGSSTACALKNVRFCYQNNAIWATGYLAITNAQFIFGGPAITMVGGGNIQLRNALFYAVPVCFNNVANGTIAGQHVTVDGCAWLATPMNQYCSVSLINSILANVACLSSGWIQPSGSYNGFYASPQFGTSPITSPSNPFQASGNGNHYLKADSVFRGSGTTAIDVNLLAELKKRSTQPPIALPRFMEVTGELTLFPQIPRYASGPPDLGYHYDMLDYTVAAMMVKGGTINIQPGTAVGFRQEFVPEDWWPWWYTEIGINLLKGSTIISHGTPNRPNVFADVQLVQEAAEFPVGYLLVTDRLCLDPDFEDEYSNRPVFPPDDPNGNPPGLDFQFSNFFASGDSYQFLAGDYFTWSPALNLSLRDCNLFGGILYFGKEGVGVNPASRFIWNNNRFDRLIINVDPDYYEHPHNNPTLYVDLAFEAHNNLFRGGLLRVMPIPATAGNWVFKDNLFDNVEFLQNTAQTLDHDYNGYWLLLSSERQWNGATRLSPNGASDQVLPLAPVYQTGPLGNHYLATSSPLYQTSKRGSRTPAEAGLYHYTTRTDQTKDGAQTGNVIIGLHYVATANSSSTQPKDSDGDDIPDFVEDANGDGQWEEGVETKINTAYTQTGVHDSVNVIYDDVDLDGDGMVGRLEKALVKNPLVSDNPLLLSHIPTGSSPEFQKFKLPLNHNSLMTVADVRLRLESGDEPEVQALTENSADASTLVVWNTTFDSPGQHFLQPWIYLKTVDFSEEGAVAGACGPLLPFQTDNALQFENLYSTFDANGAILYAQTYPGTEYSVELLDADGNHLNTITGTVPLDSTEIDVTWNLRCDDQDQTLYTGDVVIAVFTVTPPSSGMALQSFLPQTRTSWLSRSALGFGDGLFTIAYRWATSLAGRGQPFDNCIQWGAADVLLTPGAQNPHNYSSVFNDFTPLALSYYQYGGAGYIANQDRVNALLDDLSQTESVTRNFYWYGHGAPAWIGSKDDIYILASTVAEWLGNYGELVDPIPEGAPYIRMSRDHPYRFVFIDGCDAGKSSIWAQAFGMPANQIGYNQIRNHSERAQAFLGFIAPAIGVQTADGSEWYRHTLTAFFRHWMLGNRPLQECFDIASNKDRLFDYLWNVLLDHDITYEHTMPLGGTASTHPRHRSTTDLGAIYGYPYITRDGITEPPP